MLTSVEKVLFVVLALVSLGAAAAGFRRIIAIVRRGDGDFELAGLFQRALEALAKTLSQRTVLNARPRTSWFHAFVAWGFMYYFLVNLGDVLEGFVAGYHFLGTGAIGSLYRLGADLLSVAVLVGMLYLIYRRFIQNSTDLKIRDGIQLHHSV